MRALCILIFSFLYSFYTSGQELDEKYAPDLPLKIISDFNEGKKLFFNVGEKFTNVDSNKFPIEFINLKGPFTTSSLEPLISLIHPSKSQSVVSGIDQFPELQLYPHEDEIQAFSINQKFIEDMRKFRSELLNMETFLSSSFTLELATTNLTNKVSKILNHFEAGAPLPMLSPDNEIVVTDEIRGLTTECCDYFKWYRDYLIIANFSFNEAPSSKIRTKPVGSNLKRENAISSSLKVALYNDVVEMVISENNTLKNELIATKEGISQYNDSIKNRINEIETIYHKNKGFYLTISIKFKEYLKMNITGTTKKIDSIHRRLDNLVKQINSMNSQVSSRAADYQNSEALIRINEKIISKKTEENVELTSKVLDILKEVKKLNDEKEDLLKNCTSEIADENCITNPERLKELHEQINIKINILDSLVLQKGTNAQIIFAKNEENESLMKKSIIAFEEFLQIKDKYRSILKTYQNLEPESRKEIGAFSLLKLYYEDIQENFLVAIGEKLSRLERSLKGNFELIKERPIIIFPELDNNFLKKIEETDIDNWENGRIFKDVNNISGI
ncbi:hypothetical protein [Maribacter dokdonensis]|uniref:hypothetical protein n=1 Tax=Maribacter dokdonensis TaxID=320912 RepID=UPI001C0895EA|nr:hypothetical protein [Maribacter dokdonensis]MBU2902615.1 hypothetical protein [Maribacter dokdonensis]